MGGGRVQEIVLSVPYDGWAEFSPVNFEKLMEKELGIGDWVGWLRE